LVITTSYVTRLSQRTVKKNGLVLPLHDDYTCVMIVGWCCKRVILNVLYAVILVLRLRVLKLVCVFVCVCVCVCVCVL